MSFKRIFTFWILIVLVHLIASAQESIKYEKEVKIDSNLAPKKARLYVANLDVESIQWVKEYNFDSRSFEAKTLWHGLPTSIEFDTTSKLEDIEINVDNTLLPKQIKKQILKELKTHFRKIKIEKIQFQLSGADSSIIHYMNKKQVLPGLIERYEVEVFGSIKSSWRFFEFLYDKQGKFISKREISQLRLEYTTF